jgi:transposase-like protein
MLKVLVAYYERVNTVVEICKDFHITVSTLYEWKKRIESHKELLLGILVGQKTPALAFLRGLINSNRLSGTLRKFYKKYGFSFLQNKSLPASQSRPP